MSYDSRAKAYENDIEYSKLIQLKTRAEAVTQDWIDRATALHGVTEDTNDKAELVTLRSDFSNSLQSILGV